MKNVLSLFLLTSLLAASCHSIRRLIEKKTPHEQYAEKLDDLGLENTPEGRQWLAASRTALVQAQPVELPYRQLGYFQPGKPRALGLSFSAKRGQRLTFRLARKTPFTLYADLFRSGGTEPECLLSADTAETEFHYDIAETGAYILRLQPELARSGTYTLSVSTGPSLGFPVSGGKAQPGSFWGADRDGGKRSHEGVDIFAPKRTPAIAAADGLITGVREGGLGGKTVWLRPQGKDYTLYYAHLDEQLVREGQTVKAGDVVGLVGNTGNARTTASHLHFGIYTNNGAVDPYPFIDRTEHNAPELSSRPLDRPIRVTKTQKAANGTVIARASAVAIPLAATAKGYIAELEDGTLVQLPYNSVQLLRKTEAPASGGKAGGTAASF